MDNPYQATLSESTRYRSYLLRLWSAQPAGAGGWRASLEDPDTGKRLGFASLEELFIFLMGQAEVDAKGGGQDSNSCRRPCHAE